ncbi:MAG: hypothetical protein ACK5PP_06855 [Acidimicrobiales bacterium]
MSTVPGSEPSGSNLGSAVATPSPPVPRRDHPARRARWVAGVAAVGAAVALGAGIAATSVDQAGAGGLGVDGSPASTAAGTTGSGTEAGEPADGVIGNGSDAAVPAPPVDGGRGGRGHHDRGSAEWSEARGEGSTASPSAPADGADVSSHGS